VTIENDSRPCGVQESIHGKGVSLHRRDAFFCWKWFDTSATELYDLAEDLGETKDLSKTNLAQLAFVRDWLRGERRWASKFRPVLNRMHWSALSVFTEVGTSQRAT
jgi:hypothetical protein